MMKSISNLTSMVFFLLSSAALANQDNYFYVAADVGILQADFNNTYRDQTDIIPQNIAQPAEQHGYTGGVAVGYRKLFAGHYFLGTELAANIDGHSASFQSGAATAAFSDTVQIKNHVDLTFQPGMMLNDSIFTYLKLGLSYASLQDNLTSPAGFTPTMTAYNGNKNSLGFAAGLGFAKAINYNITLFTEADYHDYGTVNFSNFQNFTATYAHATHVYLYEVVIGAAYKYFA